jgi:hypothetical protein
MCYRAPAGEEARHLLPPKLGNKSEFMKRKKIQSTLANPVTVNPDVG